MTLFISVTLSRHSIKDWMVISSIYNVYLKTDKNQSSYAAHFVQHFNNTTSRTDLGKCMTFKIINQLNLICAMKTFTKHNCNLCVQERLTILKKLCDKRFTVMNKKLEIYGACRHKTTFRRFCLSTDDPVFNG